MTSETLNTCTAHGRAALPGALVGGAPACDLCVARAGQQARGQYSRHLAALFPHEVGRAIARWRAAKSQARYATGWNAQVLHSVARYWQRRAQHWIQLSRQRQQAREQYRTALDVLHRMHAANQPIPACQAQAKLVAQIRDDLTRTFIHGEPVVAHLSTGSVIGAFLGSHRYLGVLVNTQVEGGLCMLVDADHVFGIGEALPEDCYESETCIRIAAKQRGLSPAELK
ncbi:MAG: hypothetical protein IPP13_22020 [Kouleothrix sp.]|nr:hypothetical protein [Kouleothrix sp.]